MNDKKMPYSGTLTEMLASLRRVSASYQNEADGPKPLNIRAVLMAGAYAGVLAEVLHHAHIKDAQIGLDLASLADDFLTNGIDAHETEWRAAFAELEVRHG